MGRAHQDGIGPAAARLANCRRDQAGKLLVRAQRVHADPQDLPLGAVTQPDERPLEGVVGARRRLPLAQQVAAQRQTGPRSQIDGRRGNLQRSLAQLVHQPRIRSQ